MAASAAGFKSSIPPLQLPNRTRFFKIWLRTNRASHPSGSSDRRCSAFALAAWPPQKNVGAASCPIDVITDSWLPTSAPTPCWLTLQAIRFTARVTADGIPFRLVAGAPGPLPGLPPPSKLMRSSVPHQRVCSPSACGNTPVPACVPTPWWLPPYSSSLSCARKIVWLRH